MHNKEEKFYANNIGEWIHQDLFWSSVLHHYQKTDLTRQMKNHHFYILVLIKSATRILLEGTWKWKKKCDDILILSQSMFPSSTYMQQN